MQVGHPNGGIIVQEKELLFDCHGTTGHMSERVEPSEGDGDLHTIPEVLKGYAFFIKNMKNAEGAVPERARDRAHKKFTRVVSLKKLLQVCNMLHASRTKASWPGSIPRVLFVI